MTTRSTQRRRTALFSFAATAVLILTSACGSGEGAGDSDGLTIGLDLQSQNQSRWGFEAKAFEAQAKKNGDKVVVNYANFSTSKQKSDVEAMVQKGIDILVMSPIDSKAAGALVAQVQAQGIKVVTYDTTVEGAKADYAVQRDNGVAGQMHAEAALAAVPKGRYAILRGDESSSVAQGMGDSYDKLLKNNPDIDVVYDQWTTGWDSAQAQKNAEAALVKNNNQIDAFVVSWDDGAQGVAQALKAAGVPPEKVYVTGTDGAVPSLKNIVGGYQDMTVWTRIDRMATSAADIAHELGTGGDAPRPDTTEGGVPTKFAELVDVNKDNMCEFLTSIAPKGWASPDEILGAGSGCE